MTIFGSGFGADAGALSIEVAGVGCAVTHLAEHNDAAAPLATQAVRCRLGARLGDAAAAHEPLSAFAGERGAAGSGSRRRGPRAAAASPAARSSFRRSKSPRTASPAPAASTAARAGARWAPTGRRRSSRGGSRRPSTAYHFVVRRDVGSTLRWSGGAAADASEVLASADGTTERVTAGFDLASGAPLPVAVEVWESPAWTCAAPPCREDYGAWGGAAATFRTQTVDASFARPFVAGGVTVGGAVASRWRGRFRAPATGLCGDARGRPRRRRAPPRRRRAGRRGRACPSRAAHLPRRQQRVRRQPGRGRRRLRRRQRVRGRSGVRHRQLRLRPRRRH